METSAFPSRDSFLERVDELKESVPAVQAAYQPSGRSPVANLFGLRVGALLGSVCGVASAVLSLAVTAALTLLLLALGEGLARNVGIVSLALVIFAGTLGFTGALVTIFGGGWIAGLVTAAVGKITKNRNPKLASVAACIGATAGMIWLYQFTQNPQNVVVPGVPAKAVLDVIDILHRGGSIWWWICGGLFSLTAALIAANDVYAQTFCETCNLYMKESEVPDLSVDGLLRLSGLTEEFDEAEFIEAMSCVGSLGETKLSLCEVCSCGYLDIEAKMKGNFPTQKDGETGEAEMQWLAFSRFFESSHTEILNQKK